MPYYLSLEPSAYLFQRALFAFVNKNNTKLDNGLIVEYKETNSNYLYVEKSINVKL